MTFDDLIAVLNAKGGKPNVWSPQSLMHWHTEDPILADFAEAGNFISAHILGLGVTGHAALWGFRSSNYAGISPYACMLWFAHEVEGKARLHRTLVRQLPSISSVLGPVHSAKEAPATMEFQALNAMILDRLARGYQFVLVSPIYVVLI